MKFLLPAAAFAAAFFVNFLMQEFPALPGRFQYIPDAVIGMVAAVEAARLVVTRRAALIPLRYWLVFLVFAYVVASGAVLNGVTPEVTFAGIRMYLKYVPLFLLPFAFEYTERDVKRVFVFLALCGLIQIPLSVNQRFSEYAGVGTGDVVTGSFAVASSLSIVMVGLIIVMATLFVDRRMSLKVSSLLGFLYLIPAAICETKAVPFMLLIGAGSVIFVRRMVLRPGQIAAVALAGCTLMVAFVLIYDQLYSRSDGTGFFGFMASKELVFDTYNLTGVKAEPLSVARDRREIVAAPTRLTDEDKLVGRLDSLRMPLDALLPSNAIHFLFGLGIGNVTSTFGEGGNYAHLRTELGAGHTTLTQLMWETGFLGMLVAVIMLVLVAKDAFHLSHSDGPWRSLAAAWFGVTAIILSTLAYTNFFMVPEVTVVAAFFLGIVVVNRGGAHSMPRARLHEWAPSTSSVVPHHSRRS